MIFYTENVSRRRKMSDEKGKNVKDGVKKGVSIVGKVIKWIFIAILIIIVLVVGYSVYTCTAVTKAVVDVAADSQLVKDAVRDATGGQDVAKMSTEAITVSPKDLYAAYENNEVKADNTYKGRVVRLVGEVDDIGKDILDKPYIKFNADQYGMTGIQIYFKTSEQNKLGNLDKGQTVTVVGLCDGKQVINVVIKDAFLE
jgi:hypothetical protein